MVDRSDASGGLFRVRDGRLGRADSGLVAVAPPAQRGAALAVYSLLGFGAGFLAPMVFGATLDATGGGRFGWAVAFATLSAGGLLWAFISRRIWAK
jgi:MFS-type transporter involved in bile tolerance (Atg22 family)